MLTAPTAGSRLKANTASLQPLSLFTKAWRSCQFIVPSLSGQSLACMAGIELVRASIVWFFRAQPFCLATRFIHQNIGQENPQAPGGKIRRRFLLVR